jgi:endonuclease/exonuclease/phosphatase family metal-dependent hydrolase
VSRPSDRGRLLRATLAVVLLVVTLEYAVTRVFVLNFSTAGPNVTALSALLLLTGWSLPVVTRVAPATRDRLLVTLTVGGVALSLLPGTVRSLVGAALVGVALTPMLAADAVHLRRRAGTAVALGLLVSILLRAVGGATPPYATSVGRVGLVGVVLAFVAASTPAMRDVDAPTPDTLRRGSPLAAATFLAVLWLGAPVTPARWAGGPYLPTVALAAGGLLVGAWAAERRDPPTVRGTAGWAVALVAAVSVSLLGSPVAVVGVGPGAAALVVLAGTGGRERVAPGLVARRTLGVQAGCLLCLVGFTLAVNFAFVPGGEALRGTEPAFVVALSGVLGVAATLAVRGGGHGTDPLVDGRGAAPTPTGRRALLAGVAASAVTVAVAAARTPRPTDRPRTPLRVATYNVRQYFDATGRYNLEPVADLLGGRGFGVVGLQETAGARLTSGNVHGVRWLADELGYHYHPGPDTREGYGVALLSAWPIRDARAVTLPRTDGAVRVALRATVAHPDGSVPVVVAHLATDGAVRLRQAERVRALVADEDRAVVLGDFNATPTERPIETMTAAFTDAWAAAGDGLGATFPAETPSRRIDYVFLRGFRATRATVFGTADASDHRGVSATVDRG